MVDWTPRRAGAVKGTRTVTHYGHPDCAHPAEARKARLIDDIVVVTCRCGMEQRFDSVKSSEFPRQRPA